MFSGFNFAIGDHSISKEVVGFSPLWFPQGKFFVSLVSCVIVVHVILSDKILRSYCLIDKNITIWRGESVLNVILMKHGLHLSEHKLWSSVYHNFPGYSKEGEDICI